MLQSVPAQVVSQVHVASLLHTCTDTTEIDETTNSVVRALNKDADTVKVIFVNYPHW